MALPSEAGPEEKEQEEVLPTVDDYTDEERESVVKIQAAARGRVARKELAAKQARAAAAEEEEVPGFAKALSDLPPLDEFDEEAQAKITKIQVTLPRIRNPIWILPCGGASSHSLT